MLYQNACASPKVAYDQTYKAYGCDFHLFHKQLGKPLQETKMRSFIFLMSLIALSACDIPFVPFL